MVTTPLKMPRGQMDKNVKIKMCFILKTVVIAVWCIAISRGNNFVCICTRNGEVQILEQPVEISPIIATIKDEQCFKTDVFSINDNGWTVVKLGNKNGFVSQHDVYFRNCDDLTTDSFSDVSITETMPRQSSLITHHLYQRAATLGNTAKCGQNLQLWAQQGSNRVLAQRENRCYGIQIGVKQTYQYAFTYCQSSVSYLVDILDDREQAFIEMLVNRYLSGEKVWIGLHDVQNERFFDWTSGKPISYVNWFSVNQAYSSSNHDVQDCVTLVPFRGGKWEVESCYTGNDVTEPKHAFICEFEIKSPSQINAVG